jgi:ABC-type lipopolysaccharide export system ATPase subunit
METGRIILEGPCEMISGDEKIKAAYLGSTLDGLVKRPILSP